MLLEEHAGVVRTTLLCGTSGAVFFCLEATLNLLFRRPLSGLFKRKNARMSDKAANIAAAQTVTRLLIAVHNFIQIPLALYLVVQPQLQQDRMYATTDLSELMVTISAGYFLHDLLTTIPKVMEEPAYVVHAACCFYVFCYGLHTNFVHYYGAAFLLWELSTPCVHLRWALFKANMADSRIYVTNGITMIITFFLCRCVWGTYSSWLFWHDSEQELIHPRPHGFGPNMVYGFRTANIALNALNWFWFWKMIRGAVLVLVRGKPGSSVRGDKDDGEETAKAE